MEVVDPLLVSRFAVIPGSVGPLVLGGVAQRLLRQAQVCLVSRVERCPGEQAGGKCIRVMNLVNVYGRIADTERILFRSSLYVAQYMLACARGDGEESVLAGASVGIQKSMADQGCPHHGGYPFGQIKISPCLVVEMVAPAGSAVAAGLIFDQPFERMFCFFPPGAIPGGGVKPQKASGRKPMPLVERLGGIPSSGRRLMGNRRTPCWSTVRNNL